MAEHLSAGHVLQDHVQVCVVLKFLTVEEKKQAKTTKKRDTENSEDAGGSVFPGVVELRSSIGKKLNSKFIN